MEKGNFVDLNVIWKQRCELRTKGFKLLVDSDKLHAEATNFMGGYEIKAEDVKRWVKGENLYVEGYKLKTEAWQLFAEGDKLWAEAILKKYGNIQIEWIKKRQIYERGLTAEKDRNYKCKLETGELFEWR